MLSAAATGEIHKNINQEDDACPEVAPQPLLQLGTCLDTGRRTAREGATWIGRFFVTASVGVRFAAA